MYYLSTYFVYVKFVQLLVFRDEPCCFRVNVYWAFLKALYTAGGRWQVGCDKTDWRRVVAGHYLFGDEHS